MALFEVAQNAEPQKDTVGGSGGLLDSGIYDATIKTAYLTESTGGAYALSIEFQTSEGAFFRKTGMGNSIWFTNKQKKNSYTSKDGKVRELPGYTLANNISLLATETDLLTNANNLEEKVIGIYDYDAGKEVPTKVQMFTSMLGKAVKIAVIKKIEDKTAKNDAGEYVPTGETREVNDLVNALYHTDSRTVVEIQNNVENAEFATKWLDKWEGEVKNEAKGLNGTQAPKAAAASTGAAPTPAKGSLFAK